MKVIRECIKSNNLDIKTVGRGRTKRIIVGEVNQMLMDKEMQRTNPQSSTPAKHAQFIDLNNKAV